MRSWKKEQRKRGKKNKELCDNTGRDCKGIEDGRRKKQIYMRSL